MKTFEQYLNESWVDIFPELDDLPEKERKEFNIYDMEEVAKIQRDPSAIFRISLPRLASIIYAYKQGSFINDPNFPWEREDFQKWLVDRIERNPSEIFKIPEDKLSSQLKNKYKHLLSMSRAGIFK